jgi:hypothetical protein
MVLHSYEKIHSLNPEIASAAICSKNKFQNDKQKYLQLLDGQHKLHKQAALEQQQS